MINKLPMWAKVLWWLSVIIGLGLLVLSVDTVTGIRSGRYDAMAFILFNYLIIPLGGFLVLAWCVVFFVRRKK